MVAVIVNVATGFFEIFAGWARGGMFKAHQGRISISAGVTVKNVGE
jgi:hypothetical protein